jgi:hypothetical protein
MAAASGPGRALASPAATPPAGFDPGVVTNVGGNSVLLFGAANCLSCAGFNQTWVWDGAAWTQLHPATVPPPRSHPAIAYDRARNQVVMFGGIRTSTGGDAPYGDTWIWDGTNWTEAHPATSPPARTFTEMVYDEARQVTVLFGGSSGATKFNDTWTWDGTNWTLQDTPTAPSPRNHIGIAYDPIRRVTVLFGGQGLPGARHDTWLWNGREWHLKPTATVPQNRSHPGMAFDSSIGKIVMMGGHHGGNHIALGDTWLWDGSDWAQQDVTPAPGPRYATWMAAMDSPHELVLWGGYGPPVWGDTWLWNGTGWSLGAAGRTAPQGVGTPFVCAITG